MLRLTGRADEVLAQQKARQDYEDFRAGREVAARIHYCANCRRTFFDEQPPRADVVQRLYSEGARILYFAAIECPSCKSRFMPSIAPPADDHERRIWYRHEV